MAARLTTFPFPSPYLQSHNKFNLSIPKSNGVSRSCWIKCSSSNGRKPEEEKSGKSLAEEKRRAELSARIASGAFTVEKPSFGSLVVSNLTRLGLPSEIVDPLSKLINSGEGYPKIPEAKGAISAIRSEAFFIPLYELFLTYGGIFRLTFGPKVRLFFIFRDDIMRTSDGLSNGSKQVVLLCMSSRADTKNLFHFLRCMRSLAGLSNGSKHVVWLCWSGRADPKYLLFKKVDLFLVGL